MRQVDDPVATLERWAAYGAQSRIIGLSATHTKVELCTCHGEPVDGFESSDQGAAPGNPDPSGALPPYEPAAAIKPRPPHAGGDGGSGSRASTGGGR